MGIYVDTMVLTEEMEDLGTFYVKICFTLTNYHER